MRLRSLAFATIALASASASATGLRTVQFTVIDPATGKPIAGAVTLRDANGRGVELLTGFFAPGVTPAFDTVSWSAFVPSPNALAPSLSGPRDKPTVVTIMAGSTITLTQQDQIPVKEITIRVTATRLNPHVAPIQGAGSNRTEQQISKFVNTTQPDVRELTKGQAGITQDSSGQQHARGEHAEISYVIDGVMLPDTLSGRQGAIVVPSTIDNLQIITGGFAPEFGGQTAAILNISTIQSVSKEQNDLALQVGSYNTYTGDFTSKGPLDKKLSYVIDLNGQSTDMASEPQQPTNQSAHNFGWSESEFGKIHFTPNSRDAFTLTLSHSPDYQQINNRTGLPSSFARSGEGYGFLGLRNANGVIPNLSPEQQGLLGSQQMLLPSQQQDGMDIFQHEINEFVVLDYDRKVSQTDKAQLALTVLHSGQDVANNNPTVDVMDLPVDNSIEYNPTATRNVHHVQGTGSYDMKRGDHDIKFGFLADAQSGNEMYNIIPASQLALDELAALDPALAPAGSSNPNVKDINGNPVYTASSRVSPTLLVHRTGDYDAAYIQDTWKLGHLIADYGLRYDYYFQHESISTIDVNSSAFSPRLNLDYTLDKRDDLRGSIDRLFNTPPLAQGAIVGAPIQPEILTQYDIEISRKVKKNQTATLAYYYKDIRNQVDTGLLIPGSEIGLFSAVNFQQGGIHGTEFSYDIDAPGGIGWDEYLNYTYSAAKPNGLDNTGAPAPQYNDHDQRQTLGIGIAYTWKSGYSAAATFQDNSGLASSVVPPSAERTPRSQLDLHATTGNRIFQGHGGFELDVTNLFDSRQVINYQSGFSGTRFQEGRSVTFGMNYRF